MSRVSTNSKGPKDPVSLIYELRANKERTSGLKKNLTEEQLERLMAACSQDDKIKEFEAVINEINEKIALNDAKTERLSLRVYEIDSKLDSFLT